MAIVLKVVGQTSIGKEDDEHVYELLTEYDSNEVTEGKAVLVKNIRIASRESGNPAANRIYDRTNKK